MGVNGISSYTNIIDRLGGVLDKYNKHRSFTALVLADTSITLFHPFGRHFLKYRILTITKSSNLNEQSSFFVCDTTQHRATL